MLLSPFEWMVTKRYMLPGKGERFIALVAGISVGVVMLSVALLIVVMSVMNGFRGELLDRFVNLNGHAIIQGYNGRIDNWQGVLEEVRETPRVTSASPMIEKPLLVTFNGRAEAIQLRGNTQQDIGKLSENLVQGNLSLIEPDAGRVAIGSRLAIKLGARVGDVITIINPQGRSTPFGTVPRQVGYEVAALIETGIYDFDRVFVIIPINRKGFTRRNFAGAMGCKHYKLEPVRNFVNAVFNRHAGHVSLRPEGDQAGHLGCTRAKHKVILTHLPDFQGQTHGNLSFLQNRPVVVDLRVFSRSFVGTVVAETRTQNSREIDSCN